MIMGNKLKKMLNQKDNGFAATLNFKKQEDREKFISAVNKSWETGESQKVPNPQSMELKKTKGEYQYPFENMENIMDMMVYPSSDWIDFPVWVDGVSEKYSFLRTTINNTVLLNAANPKVIDVKLEFNAKENSMNFYYTSHPSNADSMDELIKEYKRFLALMDLLFKKGVTCEKLEDIKKYFNYSLKAYIRAEEISKVLEIDLTPKMVMEEDDTECVIGKIYLLLVNRSIIRQDDKLNHIEMADVANVEIGQKLFATYCQTMNLEIFGEHRVIYTVNCIFGAEIQRVESQKDGNNIVYFKDSEMNPMYRAYSAFLDENDAQEEVENIMKKREQYEKAVRWMDQLRELLQC